MEDLTRAYAGPLLRAGKDRRTPRGETESVCPKRAGREREDEHVCVACMRVCGITGHVNRCGLKEERCERSEREKRLDKTEGVGGDSKSSLFCCL